MPFPLNLGKIFDYLLTVALRIAVTGNTVKRWMITASGEKEKRSMTEGYIAAYNAFDIDKMLSFIHPQVIFFRKVDGDTINATATGINELRAMTEQSKPHFIKERHAGRLFEYDRF